MFANSFSSLLLPSAAESLALAEEERLQLIRLIIENLAFRPIVAAIVLVLAGNALPLFQHIE